MNNLYDAAENENLKNLTSVDVPGVCEVAEQSGARWVSKANRIHRVV